MSEIAVARLAADEARELESRFLAGLDDMQYAYERIVESRAWLTLGFDTFGDWWAERVQPTMRALSMRPTKEIVAAVVEQVRAEEAELPSAWRRTQRQIADMVGVSQGASAIRPRSTPESNLSEHDLEESEIRHAGAGSRSFAAPQDAVADPGPQSEPVVAMPARQDDADQILAAIDAQIPGAPLSAASASPAERPKPLPQTHDERHESQRRAAVNNLRSVLTYLVSTAIAPAELARDYAIALDEFKRDDLEFAAATMAAIADLKEQ